MAVSKTAFSPAPRDQFDDLAVLPDDRIDTVDIPETPVEAWQHGRQPGLDRPIKTPITLRLDADIAQTEINRVLRRYVADSEARA